MKKTSKVKQGGIYLAAVLVSCVFLMPFVWMLRSSLMEMFQIFVMPPVWIPNPFQPKNYIDAMTILPFARYFANTLLIIAVNMAGVLFTSSLSAFSFARLRWKGRDFVFGVIITAMMLPGAVTLIPQFVGWQALGAYNTFIPLTLPAFFGGGAFNIFLLRQFYLTIPLEFDEAAFVDGAGYFRIYASIILPLSRSALIVVALFSFMYHWNDFFGPLIYLEGQDRFTIALGLFQFIGNYNAQWHLMMAAATVAAAPPVIVFFFGQKYFIKGIVMTGLKG